MSKSQETKTDVPLSIRICLSHAYFQRLLERNSIDALHVKGYAFGEEIYRSGRHSSDVDLLVRPSHVDRLIRILQEQGWAFQAHFTTGSIFEHAATLYHPSWGLVDVHRFFPGLGRFGNEAEAFEALWSNKRKKAIANTACWIPSLPDSRLLVVLHAAKDRSSIHLDVEHLKSTLSEKEWKAVEARALQTNSLIAYDTALGQLYKHIGSPEYVLWQAVSEDIPEPRKWLARIRHADGFRQKCFTLISIFEVNVDHLSMELGHAPSAQEIRTKFFSRFLSLVKRGNVS